MLASARTPAQPKPASPAPALETDARAPLALGAITVPSGTLAVFDVALCGYLPREALAPAIVTCEVPRDRPLAVVATPLGAGRFASRWDHVAIVLGGGEVIGSRKLGEAGLDFAQLVCMDLAALDAWVHDESLDGRADVVVTGRDAGLLARSMNASRLADGYGWLDLPVADAETKADEVARRKAANHWLLASELRRHSHYHQARTAARRDPHGVGALALAGTELLLVPTTWGDGVFPIYLDRDLEDRPVRVRIQLAPAAAP